MQSDCVSNMTCVVLSIFNPLKAAEEQTTLITHTDVKTSHQETTTKPPVHSLN